MNPEKLPLQSADGAQINLDMLYQIAPSCFTEARGADGKVRRVVNFDVLRQLLGDATADTGEEFYQFTWPGKAEARREAARSISKTLRPVPEDSVDWDTTQNLYIEGDNLEVLKLLQKSYMGKVKMIYIDPPYNTGKDFVYHDDFATTASENDIAEGNTDELGNRYRRNTDSNGRFHSDWCTMIYMRLQLARNLLTEDGVIFISIDDNEVDNLKKIGNEVFGTTNFIGEWHWYKSATPPNLSFKIKKNLEYVLAWEKTKDNIKYQGVQKVSSSNDPFTKPQNSIKTLLFPAGSIKTSLKDGIYPKGIYGTDKFQNELLDDLIIKNGVNLNDVRFSNKFIWVQATLEENIRKNILIELSKKLVLSYKKADYDPECPPNLIDKSVGVNTTEESAKSLALLMGSNVFSYPKHVSLIQYLLNFKKDKEAIILDFFSGSATTAESVFRLNLDGGFRRFIMVQIQEDLDKNLQSAEENEKEILKNAILLCDELHKPHLLTEVAKERIRRAGRKIKEEAGLHGQDLDIGFREFRVDESNMEDVYFQPAALRQQDLTSLFDNVKPDRTDLDLLFGAMLDWGVQLSLPMSKATIDGRDVYTVNEGDLVACFAENITENVIAHIADQSPLRVLFRDSCFNTDADKINIFEQFKQRLNWSDEEAMKNIRVI